VIGVPESQLHARTQRSKLQLALLKEVDQSRLRLSSRLIRIDQQPSGKLSIEFEDGFRDEVDLLVGADGVRSVSFVYRYCSLLKCDLTSVEGGQELRISK
jgi:salicylate hydroxylase